MTTGEFELDSIFRQDPTGGSDDAEEVPFPPISYILWIAFVIIMPILLTNMLVLLSLIFFANFSACLVVIVPKVGLAVGDIQAVQDEAALKKLALQVC